MRGRLGQTLPRTPRWFRVLFVVLALVGIGFLVRDVLVWRNCEGITVRDALNMAQCIDKPNGVLIPTGGRR